MFNLGKFWFQKRNPRKISTLWSTLLAELSFLKMIRLVSVNSGPVPLVLKIAKPANFQIMYLANAMSELKTLAISNSYGRHLLMLASISHECQWLCCWTLAKMVKFAVSENVWFLAENGRFSQTRGASGARHFLSNTAWVHVSILHEQHP